MDLDGERGESKAGEYGCTRIVSESSICLVCPKLNRINYRVCDRERLEATLAAAREAESATDVRHLLTVQYYDAVERERQKLQKQLLASANRERALQEAFESMRVKAAEDLKAALAFHENEQKRISCQKQP